MPRVADRIPVMRLAGTWSANARALALKFNGSIKSCSKITPGVTGSNELPVAISENSVCARS